MAKTQADFQGETFNADPQSELVTVRVLRLGNGRISTGQHQPRGGDVLYEAGEVFTCPRHIADVHEANGLVEIQGVTTTVPAEVSSVVGGDEAVSPVRRGRPPKSAEA